MANLMRRFPESSFTPSLRAEWDPFQTFRRLMEWDPFAELTPSARGYQPAFDLVEKQDSYLLRADLPGVEAKDLDISVTGNRITISGKRESEQREEIEGYYSAERFYGSFSRTFTLPVDVDADHVNAELASGVLTLVVPKRPEMQGRKIEVKSKGLIEGAVGKIKDALGGKPEVKQNPS